MHSSMAFVSLLRPSLCLRNLFRPFWKLDRRLGVVDGGPDVLPGDARFAVPPHQGVLPGELASVSRFSHLSG